MTDDDDEMEENNINDSNHSANPVYQGKTDHEVILILEEQVTDLAKNLASSEKNNKFFIKNKVII